MNVRIAPSWLAAAVRSLLLLGAALAVAAVVYAANGAPAQSRKSKFDDLNQFDRSISDGVAELVTESLVLVGVTWLFREGLKVRL